MSEPQKCGDRIWQMYDGEFGEAAARKARERIHWICTQAIPGNVLDIGCSQGVCDVLLGREGYSVTGIDLDADAVEYAKKRLSSEDEATQRNVRFIVANFLEYPTNSARFSTIIMTEVLEHLLMPEQLLAKAATLLEPGGRMIVSVPFGINDWPDHKRTYYIADLFQQLSPIVNVRDVKFFGEWVACIADNDLTVPGIAVDAALLSQTEQAFIKLERQLRDRLAEAEHGRIALKKQLLVFQADSEKQTEMRKKGDIALVNCKAQLDKVSTERGRWKRQYEQLANSRLGRIQIWYWVNHKKKTDKKKNLREIAKRSPLLVSAVRFLRGAKTREDAVTTAQQKMSANADSAKNCDMAFFTQTLAEAAKIKEKSGCRYYEQLPVRIGWLSDDILYDAFKDAAPGVLLTPDQWERQINDIDILFIISGWKGVNLEWKGFAREESDARRTIYTMIDACKRRPIPTVFYSVEDPPNYDRFIGIAKKCDYVFTAAEEMLPKYRQDCGHERTYLLTYGANPLFHNPIGFHMPGKKEDVFFAGSWLDKYPERCEDVCMLFDGVLASSRKLRVFDRNLLLESAEYRFPQKYEKYILPPLPHNVLQQVQKLFDWSLNLNSVKESRTMFANRCYELQASGNLMISNYSVGVNSLLPLIFTTQHSEEVRDILSAFTDEEIYARQVMGIRFIMSGNTCFERMAELLGKIGRPVELPCRKIAVVGEGCAVQEAFDRQTYPVKELVSPDALATRYHEFDMVTFFSPEAYYGCFYLEDMANAFKYTDCDYITKAAYYTKDGVLTTGIEHDYVDYMPDKTRTLFWRAAFTLDMLVAMENGIALANGYSIDHFEYEATMQARAVEAPNYKLSVIVPVYNNGIHLYGKAFNSLRRSSMFRDMEILLVDDGSTDKRTIAIVHTLAREYANVRTFFFDDGGSGSASRPRNKGVELASADYLTFLDPDNEAINDAYAKMYDRAVHEDFDVVVGNMLRFKEKESLANYHYHFLAYASSGIIENDKKAFLSAIDFTPMSIQAMVIRKSLITRAGISQVVGAVGQDSFFSWQLICNAARILSIETPVHIYYAMVEGSTVNTISKKYFERCLLQEQVQYDWLKETGLLEEYMQKRFTRFFRDWYLVKLRQAKPGEERECAEVLSQIYRIYAKDYDQSDPQINSFVAGA